MMEASSWTKATTKAAPNVRVHSGEGGAKDGHGVEIEGIIAEHGVEEHDATNLQQETLLPPDAGRLGHVARGDGRHRRRSRRVRE